MKAAIRTTGAILLMAVAIFLPAAQALAQVPSVTINPGGGNAGSNDIRITITDTSVQVKHNGADQFTHDPLASRYDKGGLRTYFVLQQRMGMLGHIEKTPVYLKHCEISQVSGEGTAANPWKVVGQSSFKNARGRDYFVSTIYKYIAGHQYYTVDYIVSSQETAYDDVLYGGTYWLHVYLSENALIDGSNCGKGFVASPTPSTEDAYYWTTYGDDNPVTFYNTIGMARTSADCPGTPGSHVFKTTKGFSSFAARPYNTRDNKVPPGYLLTDIASNTIPADIGVAVHKALEVNIVENSNLIRHVTKQFAVGFDQAEMAGVTVTDPIPVLDNLGFFGSVKSEKLTVNFASAEMSGLEGETDHEITGLELKIGKWMFNLPQVLELTVSEIPGPGNAQEGVDYEVLREKIIIEPGIYWDSIVPIKNIRIKGNGIVNVDRKFRVEIKPLACSPHLQLGSTTVAEYTIIDDDENRIFLEPAATSVKEGETLKVKVKVTGVTPITSPLTVTLTRTAGVEPAAEGTDHATIPNTVIIPANSWETEFDVVATGDLILEESELFDIEASAVFGPKTSTHKITLTILDTTGLNPDNRVITLSAPPGMEGATVALKASLPENVTTEKAIVVTLDLNDPANTAGATDVDHMPGTLTIPAGGNSVQQNILLLDDNTIEERYEYWYFEGAATDHDGEFTIMPGSLVIEDNTTDRTIEIISSNSSRTETGSTLTLTANIVSGAFAPAGGLRIPLVLATGSTADEDDFIGPDPFEIVIPGGAGSASITLTIPVDNVWLEGPEKLMITGALTGYNFEVATINITDNTSQLAENRKLILEGPEFVTEGTSGTITARLAKPTLKHKTPVTVNLVSGATSTATTADYSLSDNVIIIPAGDNSASITITGTTDALLEPNDTVHIIGTGIIVGSTQKDTASIAIKDPPSTKITFSAPALTLTEGGAAVTVTASLEYGTAAADIPFTLSIGGGSDAVAADFNTSPATLKIPAGSQTGTFTITATEDQLLENTETLELSGTLIGYTFEGLTFQIEDKESADEDNKKISIVPQASTVNEGNDVTVRVSLPSNIYTADEITVSLSRGAGSSTDLQATEYTFPTEVKIPAGGNEITFTLHANTDNVIEADEDLVIAGAATVTGDAQTATGTVTVKDVRPATIQLEVTGPTDITEGFTGNWRIALPSGVTTETPVVIGIAPATTGNTTTSDDFVGNYPVSATIAKGQLYIDVPFEAKADNIVEGQERLEMTLSATGFTFTKHIGMDVKDTDPASLQIKLTAGAATLNEGASVLITATLDGFTSESDIDVVLSAGAASVAGTDDYNALGTIHIGAGSSSGTFTLQSKADLVLENDELLAVRGESGTYTVQGVDVTIKDVTGTNANKTLSLTPAVATVAEGNKVTMTVSLPAGITTSVPITVNLAKGAGSDASISSTDYALPLSVEIPEDENSIEFDVEALTDKVIEPSEKLQVTAAGTVFGYASSDASDVTITDVSTKLITVSGPATVTEGGNIKWRFELPTDVTTANDINISLTQDATGTAELADLEPLPVLKIAAGASFGEITFEAKADNTIEATETLKLTPSATGGFTFSQPVSFTITDNDLAAAGITLSATPNPVSEGGNVVVKATLTGGVISTNNITISLAKDAASTLGNTEHGTLGNIVIAAGDTEGTFTLSTNTDNILEQTETLVLTGTATASIPVSGVTVQVEDATGTTANKTLQISPLTASIAEGDVLEFTVGLPGTIVTSEDITVSLSQGTGSAATLTAADYAFPATVVIEAGTNHVKFNVEAKTDGLIEAAELLKLRAGASVFGNNSTAVSDVTITDVSNKLITVSGPATVAEGGNIKWRFELPAGVTSASDINISLTLDPSGTAELADLTSLPALKIEGGASYGEITFAAASDLVIETTETLKLTPSATGGFTFSQPVSFTITDGDLSAAGIALSVSPSPVAEGTSATVKATLTGGVTSTGNITVTLGKDASSTLDNSEHGALGTITIAAGATEGTYTLTTGTDDILEPAETLVLTGTATSAIPVTGATLQVTDATGTTANKTIQISPLTATLVEGNEMDFTVSLPGSITTSQDITVTLTKGAGSAATLTSGDYAFPATVVIEAGKNSATFKIEAKTDGLIETAELLQLTAGATVFGHNSSAVSDISITDVSNKHITVTGPATVAESGSITWRFALPAGVTAASDINITLTANAASTAVLADFAALPALKIAAGALYGEITFNALSDDLIEPTETMILQAAATGGFTFSQPVTFTITDGDLAKAGITLAAAPATVAEGGSTEIKATLTGGVTATSAISVTLTKNGASTLADNEHGALGVITIAAGETEGTLTLTTSTDKILEPSETLVLGGTATSSIPVSGTTVTVTDATGTNANKTITLTPVTATIVESGKVTMTVSLPEDIITSQAVTISLAKGPASSATLTAGDYSFPATVTIDAGTGSKSFDVTAVADALIESSEQLELVATATVYGFTSSDASKITITDISDKHITVSGAATVAEGSAITWRFALPDGVSATSDISITLTADPSSTATLDDLMGVPSLKILAGEPFGEITFTAKTDNLIEPAETLVLNPSTLAGFTFSQPVTFTITDGDLAAAGITLSATPSGVTEGNSTVIKATLTGGVQSSADITVTLTKDAASTLGNSEHGALGTIVIPANGTEGTFTLGTHTDQLLETTENLVLGGSATGSIPVTGTTITVSDATGTTANKSLRLTPGTATVAEGGKVMLMVALPENIITTQAITVALSKGAGSGATLTAGDYSFPATVNIDAGTNGKTFEVEALADGHIEGQELLELTVAGTVFGHASTATADITITDVSDKTITVSGPANVVEGQGIVYRFSLPTGVTATSDITVNLAAVASSTATLADLTGLPVVKITAGQPFGEVTFTAKADQQIEPVETLTLTPSAAGFTFSQNVSFTITDADLAAAGIQLSVAPASIAEGGSTAVKATLTGGVTAKNDIVITLSKDAASTLSNTEHGTLGTITIASGDTEGTFTLTTNTDQLLEPTETLVLGGTSDPAIPVTGAAVSVTDATGSNANKTLSLTPAIATIMEGNSVTMTVSLPAGILSTAPVNVNLSAGANTAASLTVGEYSFPASVTIPAMENSVTFQVSAITDGNIESPELLELEATGMVFGFASTDKSNITITDVSTRHITVTGPATVSEGSGIVYRFSLPSGVTAASDIHIALTADPSSTATLADMTGLPAVTIAAGQPYTEVTFTAKADLLIEPAETLTLNPSATDFTFSQPLSFSITDGDMAASGITLTSAPASIQEGGSALITATLTGGATATSAITVTLAKDGASTLGDVEHEALGTITIPAGTTEGTFILTTKTDFLLESSETLVLGGNANPNIPVTGVTLTVTDATGTDANKTLQLTPATATIAEGDKLTMTVALPANIITTQPVTVTLSKGAGSAASVTAGDYILPATVTIEAGSNSQTFEVEAATDAIIESNELLQVTADATIFGFATSQSSNITLTDVSDKLITVAGPASVVEGNSVTWTFSLPAGVTSEVPVVISLAQGAATPAASAADLEGGLPATVTIAAGATTASLVIETKADQEIETMEKLELVPTATGGFTFSKNILVDIQEAPVSGNITMTASAATIREGATATTITVSLPGTYIAGSDIVVNIAKSAVSSAANGDHSALPASVTIGVGQHAATFTVSAVTDNILEQIESLQLEGTAAGFVVDGISISLEDATRLDPANTKIVLLPAGASIAEGNAGQFRISLPAGITSSTDITVQLSKEATSTAADTDHGAITANVTIPALANTSADFTITAVTDGILEGVEELHIGGNAPAGFTFDGGIVEITDGTGLIAANRHITITIDSTTLHEGNFTNVRFSLPAGISTASPITIMVGASAAQSATAADFSISPTPVTIGAGQQSVTVQLTAVPDMIAEVSEVLQITATATGFTFAPAATITIPGEPAPGVHITATKAADAAEPSTHGSFRLQLASGVAPADITLNYTTGGTATSGKDYTALTGTAVVKAGESGVDVTVHVLDDKILENNETVTLTLVSGSFEYLGATVPVNIATSGAVSMSLADDDMSISRGILIEKIADAAEPATAGRVRVRFADTDLTTVVPVNVSYNIGGTASAGADYQVLTGSVDISAGQKEAIITIQPVNDNILEPTETIEITLTAASAPLGSYTWPIDAQHTATVNLIDDDQIRMELAATAEVNEGGNLTVTLRSSEAFPTAIPVFITMAHDAVRTVTTATPRTGTTLTVTMPANETEVTFQLTSDENDTNDDEGYINLTIQPHSGAGQAYRPGTDDRTSTAVKDNDVLTISFASDSSRIDEGNSGMAMMPFKVVLSRKSTRPITVEYAFADAFEGQGADKDLQRAKAAEDFQDATRSIVIAAGAEEGVMEVPVIGDTQVEEDEYFAVKLTGAVVASSQNVPVIGTAAVAVGVIVNDDVNPDMEVRVHKGLSPNGDGINDALVIENIEKYGRSELVIVNRWGGTVFQTVNYHNQNNAFKGLANRGGGNGSQLPDGSYFYVLQVWDAEGKLTRYNGYIVLKSAQ